MRPTPQVIVKGGHSLIETYCPLPLWMRVSLRNVLRVPSRSLATGTGDCVCVYARARRVEFYGFDAERNSRNISRDGTLGYFCGVQHAAFVVYPAPD